MCITVLLSLFPIAGLMIERYLNDTIANARKPIQERMVKANLIEKFLKDKGILPNQPPVIRRDTLPDPSEIPSDDPNAPAPRSEARLLSSGIEQKKR
jgi:hypothetical protein